MHNTIFYSPLARLTADWERPAHNGAFRVDIEETDDAYRIHAELPGVEKDKTDVRIKDNVLTISAEFAPAEGKPLRHERPGGKQTRRFVLSRDVNGEAVNAGMKNGVLTLTLPKQQTALDRRINIA